MRRRGEEEKINDAVLLCDFGLNDDEWEFQLLTKRDGDKERERMS